MWTLFDLYGQTVIEIRQPDSDFLISHLTFDFFQPFFPMVNSNPLFTFHEVNSLTNVKPLRYTISSILTLPHKITLFCKQ